MFEVIFILVGAALAVLFLIGLCTFFYLGYKQLFGDDNEK